MRKKIALLLTSINLGFSSLGQEVSIEERWACPWCGHMNGDWTSICGQCGKSS